METITKKSHINSNVFAGNIVADGTEANGRLTFRLAVEQGKDEVLFLDCVQFAAEGRELVTPIVKKGRAVTVEGYLKDNPKDGYKNLSLVVTSAYPTPKVGTTITGNAVADGIVRTHDGKAYLNFRIAHNQGKDADGNTKALFLDVTLVSSDPEKLPAIRKGESYVVKGHLGYKKTVKEDKTYEDWRLYAYSVRPNEAKTYALVETSAETAPSCEDMPVDFSETGVENDLPY